MQLDYQHQIVVGAILGGSSLVRPSNGKNYHISMRSKNELWLKYKMANMPKYFTDKEVYKYGNTYRVNSICSEKLNEMRQELYCNNKRHIKMETLDVLRDIALSIWFLDGGNKAGRQGKNAYLNTTKFGKNGTDVILQYFNEIGLPCSINKDGKRTKILFTVKSTMSFFKIIAHKFPTFMHHRL